MIGIGISIHDSIIAGLEKIKGSPALQAVAAALYSLRTLFSDAGGQPVTLVNGQKLHEDNDGLDPTVGGYLKITAPANSTISLDSALGALEVETTANVGWGLGVATFNAITYQNGTTLYAKVNSTSDVGVGEYSNIKLGWSNDATVDDTITGLFINNAIGGANIFDIYAPDKGGSASTQVQVVDGLDWATYNGTDVEFAIVVGTNNVFGFVKGAGFATWTLLYIFPNSLAASGYGIIPNSVSDLSGSKNLIKDFSCDETLLNTTAITPTATLTNETATNTHADVVVEGSHTAVTGQTLQIDYRGDSTFDNCWRVKVAQGTANNVTLHKVTAGAESAALSTGSATINNATSYRVQVHHQDANYVKVYVAGVEECSYTTSDTHQQTATNTRLQLGTISTVSMGCYHRDGVTINV